MNAHRHFKIAVNYSQMHIPRDYQDNLYLTMEGYVGTVTLEPTSWVGAHV